MSEVLNLHEVGSSEAVDYEELMRLIILDKIRRKYELKLPTEDE